MRLARALLLPCLLAGIGLSSAIGPALARTVDLRNLPVDVQQAMLLVCKVSDGKIEQQHIECLDHHVRVWRKLVFKPELDGFSLRQARRLREACETDQTRGPGPWARCIEQQMVAQRVAAAYPDLAALTNPQRNRIRQRCEAAGKVSSYREAACLTKLRDRTLKEARALPKGKSPVASTVNTRQGNSPSAERIQQGGRQVAVLTPGILNFQQLDPSNPFWPGWRGVRPARPDRMRGDALLPPQQLYASIARSVYVVLGAASADNLRQARNVRQGSAVAISKDVLATNCHVLQGAQVIVLLQGEINGRAELVYAHPSTDRCLLRSLDMALEPVPGIRAFADLKMGEPVWSVSAPHGLQHTLHDGIVSQLRSNNGVSLIQTSAHAAPGSSGGGLFDSQGNLVGITNFTVAEDTRLHFAIAADAFWE